MSDRRSDTSSKRKRTTPQKLKNRKLFAVSEHDLIESSDFSRARDGENQDSQLCLSQLPETLHNRENVPKSLHQMPSKKESLTETPQNKENMPGKYSSGTGTVHRGRGRPKGSKNKTFPVSPTRVYSVREGKSPVYSPKKENDTKQQNGLTPHRGRGRPKGSTKIKSVGDVIPKRSRGRPKGSKNKKPSKAALMKLIPGSQKVGRGRPRKLPLTSDGETPKRGRGRPKGSLNKIPSAKKTVLSSGTHEKRKRGRPKKIVLHHSTAMPLTPKRPRGRPKSTGSHAVAPSNLLKLSEYYTDLKDEEDEDDDKEDDEDEEDESDE
ncbi:uncharacterized protein RB166_020310 isoform 2-T2 [Leptodactylus fuscus]|uniref:uncharacterized protein LOC142185132 isoform X2 n=1 Tax=Leptodactylus fuscus TaxID=238119 RepID=UPI003F4E6221